MSLSLARAVQGLAIQVEYCSGIHSGDRGVIVSRDEYLKNTTETYGKELVRKKDWFPVRVNHLILDFVAGVCKGTKYRTEWTVLPLNRLNEDRGSVNQSSLISYLKSIVCLGKDFTVLEEGENCLLVLNREQYEIHTLGKLTGWSLYTYNSTHVPHCWGEVKEKLRSGGSLY